MKIVTHKCPNCGSILKLGPNKKTGTCEYCKNTFTIDDEVIRVEHKATVEIKDDNDLEIAITTLEKFKDYQKSEHLFKNLIYRYAHKKEVYIGIVRSITHDFTKSLNSINRVNEVNKYFNKYKALASEEAVKYEYKINEINKNYWYQLLISATANFKVQDCTTRLKDIEKYWKEYITYCDETEKETISVKYNDFIKNKKNKDKQTKRIIIFIIIGLVLASLIAFLIHFIPLYKETPSQLTKEIKISDFSRKCYSEEECNENKEFFKKYFKETKSDLFVRNINIDWKNKILTINLNLENNYKTSNHNFEFQLIDDKGPQILDKNCKFTDTEKVDVNQCFSIIDDTGGEIENSKAMLDYNEDDFKTEGSKRITVTATDKEGNTTTKDIYIIIIKTPVQLKVNLSKYSIPEGSTTKLSYSIGPNNLPNKKVNISYDKKYVSIDKNNNVKALKKGETKICVSSVYDSYEEDCVDLKITMKCKSTYTFKFSGAEEEILRGGEDFCAGTYRVYASVLNYNSTYWINIIPPNAYSGEMLYISKSSSLNDEGKKYATTNGTRIEVDPGITQVKLVKVS